MPIGDNLGGQLNIIIFEVGMITRDPAGVIPDVVSTIAVHPMLVAPTSIRYLDNTRSTVQETHSGSVVTKAGRAMRTGTLTGSFGVISRGLGPIIGTGELRFQRFMHEVVRLSDAVDSDQVNAEKDPFRSPLLNLALLPYDSERTTFFVNYYDFWHNIEFECLITSFSYGKTHRGGGATGLTQYTLQLKECGPIVTGGLGTTIINGLFQALTTWESANQLIESYTLDVIVTSFVDAAGIVVSEFVNSVNAFKAQVDGATALLNGSADPTASIDSRTAGLFGSGGAPKSPVTPPTPAIQPTGDDVTFASSGLSGFLPAAAAVGANAQALHDAVHSSLALDAGRGTGGVDSPGGEVAWDLLDGEGSIRALDVADALDNLAGVAYAAAAQAAMGGYYGMSRDEFAAFLSSSGATRRPGVGKTVLHSVSIWDTADTITRMYGVGWNDVLTLNNVLPDEALLPGSKLLIPQANAVGQQSAIRGLPTLGSHSGQAAWGSDCYIDLRVDSDGKLQIVSGPEVLEQGVDWLIADSAGEIADLANHVAGQFQGKVVGKRLAAILATDRRVDSVETVSAEINDAGNGLDIETTINAINGGSLTIGAGA